VTSLPTWDGREEKGGLIIQEKNKYEDLNEKTHDTLACMSKKCSYGWHRSAMDHLTSLGTQKHIFKVDGPM
jgi:hypothetical protein